MLAIISSPRVSVLVNGAATKQFKLQNRIRQGDPLSPFLFIIVMEGLKVALFEAMEKGFYKGIDLPNNGPKLSIFQFTDDTLFLGKGQRKMPKT